MIAIGMLALGLGLVDARPLRVTVVDGEPVAGAEVRVIDRAGPVECSPPTDSGRGSEDVIGGGPAALTVRTDAHGRVTFEALVGDVWIAASAGDRSAVRLLRRDEPRDVVLRLGVDLACDLPVRGCNLRPHRSRAFGGRDPHHAIDALVRALDSTGRTARARRIRVVRTEDPSAPFGRRELRRWPAGGPGFLLPLALPIVPGTTLEIEAEEVVGRAERRTITGNLLYGTILLRATDEERDLDLGAVVLHPAPRLVDGTVDRGRADPGARIRVHLLVSELPTNDVDRDAARSCLPHPTDPARLLRRHRSIDTDPLGRYRIDAPRGPRWWIQAEVVGWWRSEPVSADRPRIDFAMIDAWTLAAREG